MAFLLRTYLGIGLGLLWYVVIFMTDHDRFWNHYVLKNVKQAGREWIFQQPYVGGLQYVWNSLHAPVIPLLFYFLKNPKKLLKNSRLPLFASTLVFPICFFTYFPYKQKPLYIILPILFSLSTEECESKSCKRTL